MISLTTPAISLAIISSAIGAAKQPNVLFLAVDDMRAWTGCLNKGYPGKIHTPNIDKLAKRGRLFTNAHVPAPKCGPCRASVLTGQLPSSIGIYGNNQWLHPSRPDLTTMPKHFKTNGYHTVGSGKITHHTAGFNPPSEWHDFREIRWEDSWDRPKSTYPLKGNVKAPPNMPLSGLSKRAHELDWGTLPKGYKYHDPESAQYAVNFLANYKDDKPFFLACGIFRPHAPWYAPKEYFDLYPLEKISTPLGVKDGDLEDTPKYAKRVSKSNHYDLIKGDGKYKHALQAYLASISFADAQIGKVLEALEKSGKADNTIIVFWSDHGWHHGEKNHWHKWTLWECATHIPMIIAGPTVKQAGVSTNEPVSALSLFPTLIDLCAIPAPKQKIDEQSLKPLLADPKAAWKEAVVMELNRGSAAVRSKTHRYIRYSNGDEELYDHTNDPYEFNNLAGLPNSKAIITKLEKYIAKEWHERIPSKGAFMFDPAKYTWEPKK